MIQPDIPVPTAPEAIPSGSSGSVVWSTHPTLTAMARKRSEGCCESRATSAPPRSPRSSGSRKLYRYIADFGFIGDTRSGLIGERRGSLTPPSTWAPIKQANVSFGQGVSVTALQVAVAYGAIAGGKLMQPLLHPPH